MNALAIMAMTAWSSLALLAVDRDVVRECDVLTKLDNGCLVADRSGWKYWLGTRTLMAAPPDAGRRCWCLP
jgi:hypothetical protein